MSRHGIRALIFVVSMAVTASPLQVSSEAHLAGMRTARPGGFGYEVVPRTVQEVEGGFLARRSR